MRKSAKGLFRKLTVLGLCVSMTLTSACSMDLGFNKEKTGKYAWIDSNLNENSYLLSSMRLEDDYAAAVNAEWMQNHEYDPSGGNGSFEENTFIMDRKRRDMLDDTSLNSKNLELLRTFDGIYSDWEYRAAEGTEPLKKYLAYIDEINSVDDVKSYMLDNSKNPFALMLVKLDTRLKTEARDHYTLQISQPEYSLEKGYYYTNLNDMGLQKLETAEKITKYVLGRSGYQEDETDKLIKNALAFESKLTSLSPDGDLYISEVVGRDEIYEKAGNYPVKELLEHYGLTETKNYCADMKYLASVGSVLKEENLEAIKAYFKVNLVLKSVLYLDRDILDYSRNTKLDKTNQYAAVRDYDSDRLMFLTIADTPLNAALDQAFLDTYFNQAVYDDVLNIADTYVEAYKDIIAQKDWLSDENKKTIEEKLDNITFNIIKPSNEADMGDMSFVPKEEGGSLLDAMCELNRFKLSYYGEITSRPYDRTYWDIYELNLSTGKVNAFYDKFINGIYICIGILNGDMYSDDMTLEQKFGGIGAIMGHELSHAFDSDGVKYDKNGDPNPIIAGNDMNTFSERADKVKAYYKGITPFPGCDSYPFDNTLSAEAIADMGGVKATLLIAGKMDDFDYDSFFRGYANTWKNMQTKGSVVQAVREDSHPLKYLRVNVTIQQFDEFYETYDIKPGDNMYLAPEDRIAIW